VKDPEYLRQVDVLTQKLFKSVQDTEQHVTRASADRAEASKQHRAEAKKAEAILNKSNFDAVSQIDKASAYASTCLTRLQHEHCALGTVLLVCQRRLELREGRPTQELEDSSGLEKALLHEEKILTSYRDSTLVLGGDLMTKIDMAAKLRNGVSGQRANMRAAIRRNKNESKLYSSCPSPAGSTGLAQIGSPMLPGSPYVDPADQLRQSMTEAANHRDTMSGLIKEALDLNNHVDDLGRQSDSLIAQSQREAAQANRQVVLLLERNTLETTELTKKIRSRITDADSALAVAEKMLGKSRKKLNPDDGEAMAKLMESETAVEELRTTRRDLQEDLYRKTVTLNIDEQCRRVTPQWAASRQRQTGSTTRPGGPWKQ
jgi:hypothetical protein